MGSCSVPVHRGRCSVLAEKCSVQTCGVNVLCRAEGNCSVAGGNVLCALAGNVLNVPAEKRSV